MEVTNENELAVVSADGVIEVMIEEPDYSVSVNKKEYTIVGDGLYIPSRYEDAPQWLRDTIATVTDTSFNQKITELNNLTTSLNQLIVELEVAKNTYTNSIISSADIDERINARIETLNSSLSDSDATIVDLIATKATPTEASAIATDVLSASISGTENGTIGALVGSVQNAVANLDTALSNSIDIVHAELDGNNEITAEAIGSLQAYVGVDQAGASSGTGLSAYLEGSDGVVGSATSNVANLVYTDGGTAKSKFEYNSNLSIAGQTYQSGFGLVTSVSAINGKPASGSEFWINASKFKFTNPNNTGAKAPFTIDATGTVPEITFNGKVAFTNVTGYTPPDVSGSISTNNDAFAQKLGYANYTDMVNRANAGQTIITGGYLRTSLISANTITASQINTAGLIAENISATTITGKTINSSTLNSPSINSGTITSSNYIPSISGYRLNYNGSAEFNGVVISRDLVLANGTVDVPMTRVGLQWTGKVTVNTGLTGVGTVPTNVSYFISSQHITDNIQYVPASYVPPGNNWGTLAVNSYIDYKTVFTYVNANTHSLTWAIHADITVVFDDNTAYSGEDGYYSNISRFNSMTIGWALKKLT